MRTGLLFSRLGGNPLHVAAVALLLVTLLVAPFPYGGLLPGGTLRLELLAFAALCCSVAGARELAFGEATIPLLAVVAIVALGLFQLLPLGNGVVRLVSPRSAEAYANTAKILTLHDATASIPAARISLAPRETWSAILLTLTYGALFVSAFLTLRRRVLRNVFGWGVIVAAAIQIAIGATTNDLSERVHASFVNPNHLAGYLQIALAVTFSLLWAKVATRRDRTAGVRDRATRFERQYLPLVPLVILWGFIAGGIAITRSRGGVMSALVALVVLIVFATVAACRVKSRRWVPLLMAAAVLVGIGSVIAATGWAALSRFESDAVDINSDFRVRIWQESVRAWLQFPIFGSGLGALREAFRRVQPADFPGLLEFAHNDLLQLLVGGGIIGALLGVLAVGGVLAALVRAWREQRHREESALTLGAIGALVSLLVHGCVEFNLSMPAISATLAMVAGWGLAAGTARGDEAS